MTSARSETIYVSRAARAGLETLAMLNSAHDLTPNTPLASVDSMADDIILTYLDAVPQLQERRKAIRDAIREIDAQFTRKPEATA